MAPVSSPSLKLPFHPNEVARAERLHPRTIAFAKGRGPFDNFTVTTVYGAPSARQGDSVMNKNARRPGWRPCMSALHGPYRVNAWYYQLLDYCDSPTDDDSRISV